MEGLEVAAPGLQPYVVPLTLVALVALFVMQKHGTSGIGAVFGPVMVLWFIVLAVSGLMNIKDSPHILAALNPLEGLEFCMRHRWLAFVALGAVVLSLTGAEALYADMGHFGSRPIRLTWFAIVFPRSRSTISVRARFLSPIPPRCRIRSTGSFHRGCCIRWSCSPPSRP